MKKIIVVFVLIGIINHKAVADMNVGATTDATCTVAMFTAFANLQKELTITLASTNLQMTTSVIPSAEANVPKIKSENAVLRELIATQQAINLQQEELIFNLEKKIQMRK